MAKREEILYPIEEALNKIKDQKTKFDATVEVHINLLKDKKQEMNVRYTTTLPQGTGKTKRVAVLASKKVPNADLELMEEDLEKIEKGKLKPKVDFDVFISEPRFMPKIAKVARVLGPVGMMPNPKTGTVTENVEEAVNQVKKGKIEVRTEKDIPVIHTLIGKHSFTKEQLLENYKELMQSLKQNRPPKSPVNWIKSVFLCTTMGKSVQVDLNA
jgi:large subunit ribosomal protein L1